MQSLVSLGRADLAYGQLAQSPSGGGREKGVARNIRFLNCRSLLCNLSQIAACVSAAQRRRMLALDKIRRPMLSVQYFVILLAKIGLTHVSSKF